MNKRKRNLTSQEFKKIYSRVPRATVEVVVTHNNKVVLIKREEESWHGQHHIPGGTVLYQERLIDAVKRVAREEIGIDVEIVKQDGYIQYPSEQKERGFGWSIGLVFICKVTSEIDLEIWKKNGIALYDQLPENTITEQVDILNKILNSFSSLEE